MTTQMLRRNFFDFLFANAKESRIGALSGYILKEFDAPFLPEDSFKKLKIIIRSARQKFEQKWSKVRSHSERVLKINFSRLDECISFSDIATGSIESISNPGLGEEPADLKKTLKVGEFETSWTHQTRKTYRWRLKYCFAEKAKEIQ
ncbi:hypothetical protein AVEN_164527-1 [Araneus ventricosus]|uniref:Uncharacterized protein n=1 Tax=Araneus ventricosus TaxID=182803 RepID=A0A4Y2B2R4_ARAVE|nr:hypothetical protein AVEN_164527-1 [Araneus ventricosus]